MSRRKTTTKPRGISDEDIARLEALYATLPVMQCRGLCADSCVPVSGSAVEMERVKRRGFDLHVVGPDLTCSALSRTFGQGRCQVYEVRPTVCRLWGVAASMPCPHGCVPEGGHLDDETAMRLMVDSIAVGGPSTSPIQDLLNLIGTDPRAKMLLGGLMRGDRSVKAELSERIRALQAPTKS